MAWRRRLSRAGRDEYGSTRRNREDNGVAEFSDQPWFYSDFVTGLRGK
jgi:hypothetical protein